MHLPTGAIDTLHEVSTATITSVLLKKGIRNIWIRDAHALDTSSGRIVGPAFTLRFVPMREDLATPASWASPTSTRGAVEAMPEGCIAVAGALGVRDAGIFGDILCARMAKRGVAGLVTDGALRDRAGIAEAGLPVWSTGIAAPASVVGLTFVGWQEPIGCGGTAVFPGDIIVADGDGAVVIPKDKLDEVLVEAPEHERMDAWVMKEVAAGNPLPGLYPMNEETHARYLAEISRKDG